MKKSEPVERGLSRIQALGEIQGVLKDLNRLEKRLKQAPLWRPGTALIRECREASRLIAGLKARFEQKLVVTLIGPSGSGKSTLFNALAGVDDLSKTGSKRPTTEKIVLLSQKDSDITDILGTLETAPAEIHHRPECDLLRHMVLIDTPDTDSTHLVNHRRCLHQVLALSDVLICLFDAQNPKRRDHVDFLSPHVRRFEGASLIVVLNKCDRLDEEELGNTIVPEFTGYLEACWGKPAEALFCISARNHLKDPRWDATALPRHGFDQFDGLKKTLQQAFAKAGARFDRRLKNARALWEAVSSRARREALKDRKPLIQALDQIQNLEKRAAEKAVTTLQSDRTRLPFSVPARIYQELAQRWTGPVGWLIAVWARFLMVGSGIRNLFRLPGSVRHLKERARAFHPSNPTGPGAAMTGKGPGAAALFAYRFELVRHWGDMAAALVKGRFDPWVWKVDTLLQQRAALEDYFSFLWDSALETEIQRTCNRLSGVFLQLLFNLPGLGILGYAAWVTVNDFIRGRILPFDFFLHALFAVGVILLLSFFAYQALVRFAATKHRLEARALETARRMAAAEGRLQESPLVDQITAVLSLTDPSGIPHETATKGPRPLPFSGASPKE